MNKTTLVLLLLDFTSFSICSYTWCKSGKSLQNQANCIGQPSKGGKFAWSQARFECAKVDGQLVEIHYRQKNVDISKLLFANQKKKDISSKAYWIGLSDVGHIDEFFWNTSGEKLNLSTYIPWRELNSEMRRKTDDEEIGNCVALQPDLKKPKWIVRECTDKLDYLCEKKVPKIKLNISLTNSSMGSFTNGSENFNQLESLKSHSTYFSGRVHNKKANETVLSEKNGDVNISKSETDRIPVASVFAGSKRTSDDSVEISSKHTSENTSYKIPKRNAHRIPVATILVGKKAFEYFPDKVLEMKADENAPSGNNIKLGNGKKKTSLDWDSASTPLGKSKALNMSAEKSTKHDGLIPTQNETLSKEESEAGFKVLESDTTRIDEETTTII